MIFQSIITPGEPKQKKQSKNIFQHRPHRGCNVSTRVSVATSNNPTLKRLAKSVSSPTIFRLSFTCAAAASKLLKAISWNHWIRQMIFLKTDRYQKCHEVGVVGRRSSKKGMYELFPMLFLVESKRPWSLRPLPLRGERWTSPCFLPSKWHRQYWSLSGTGEETEWSKLSVYNIRAQSSYPWEQKNLSFFATNKIRGKKAFVHCILLEGGGIGLCLPDSMQAEAHVWKLLLHDTPPKPPNRFASWSPSFGVVSPP